MNNYTFNTLENTSTLQILNSSNEAFSDYVTPLQLTQAQLESKMDTENTNLQFSVGAFYNNELVGFILHGITPSGRFVRLYNGGTGVVPAHRGHQLTTKMYDYLFTQLKDAAISEIVLEVITENKKAYNIYKALGFETIRTVACWKGEINSKATNTQCHINIIHPTDWESKKFFWDILPSWQNDIQAITLSKSAVVILGAFVNNELVGYAAYHTLSKKLLQIAIKKEFRKQKIASTLCDYIAKAYHPQLVVTNVDTSNTSSSHFLEQIGLTNFVNQYEMVKKQNTAGH